MKNIKLILEDLRTTNSDPGNAFRVKKATNTTEYPIGEVLSKGKVNELCKLPGYTVDIVAKQ